MTDLSVFDNLRPPFTITVDGVTRTVTVEVITRTVNAEDIKRIVDLN
ncbi:MAG: hypothetical protein HF308_20085 [Ignavibacteria bacterium]|jgi:hypothetical protein|nr:hypothetical protein [Ignavibacteria bacterium]